MKNVWLVGMVAALTLASGPAWAEEPIEEEVAPAKVLFGSSSTLIVDAADAHSLIEAKTEALEFKDWWEFASFLKENVNAEIVYDDNGEPIGWDLDTNVIGTPFYLDREGLPVFTDNPAAVIIGGTTGFVNIGGQALCVNADLCPAGEMMSLAAAQGYSTANAVLAAAASSIGSTTGRWVPGGWAKSAQEITVKTMMPAQSYVIQPCSWGSAWLCAWYTRPLNTLSSSTFVYLQPDWDISSYIGHIDFSGNNVRSITNVIRRERADLKYASTVTQHNIYDYKTFEPLEDWSCLNNYTVSCPCPF